MLVQDNVASSLGTGPGTSVTLSFTCGTIANGGLFAVIICNGSATATNISATYAGVSMTKIFEYASGNVVIAAFYLLKPASGTNNIAYSWTNSAYAVAAAASYSGVNQGSPVLAGSLVNNASASINVTSLPGDIVMDVSFAGAGTTPTVGSGQTTLVNNTLPSSNGFGSASTEPGVNGNVTMDWSRGSWHAGFSIHYASGSVTPALSPFMHF